MWLQCMHILCIYISVYIYIYMYRMISYMHIYMHVHTNSCLPCWILYYYTIYIIYVYIYIYTHTNTLYNWIIFEPYWITLNHVVCIMWSIMNHINVIFLMLHSSAVTAPRPLSLHELQDIGFRDLPREPIGVHPEAELECIALTK